MTSTSFIPFLLLQSVGKFSNSFPIGGQSQLNEDSELTGTARRYQLHLGFNYMNRADSELGAIDLDIGFRLKSQVINELN